MIHQTVLENLDICGLMILDQPEVPCPCDACEDILVEAWERMIFGGVVVANEPDPARENLFPRFLPPYATMVRPFKNLFHLNTRGQ